ncbi:MAG: energy-coupling factor ABC transporter substrate-binding protein [Limnothrix sp. BL-A-16]|jgi:cobalt/nickel transport protein
MNNPLKKYENGLLVIAVLALAVLPLFWVKGDYEGADVKAEEMIGEVQPGYQPWFQPLFEPPSGEIESLLFASQAALGAGTIGFVIGRYRGKSKGQDHRED